MAQFSILLCEDDFGMRTALRALFESDGRFAIAGEACDGVEAVEKAAELQPDVLLLDVTMPRQTGIEALPKVLRESPHSSVVMLTALSRETLEQSTVMEVDSLRGVYYMDKSSEGEELLDSIAGIATASLSTPAAGNRHRTKAQHRQRTTRFIEVMTGGRRRGVLGALAAAALAAVAVALAIGSARSAAGSCVTAGMPNLSQATLYARATQACSGSNRMLVLLQGRWNRNPHVYTLASGSTSGLSITVGTHKCALSGTWYTWTLAVRGVKTDTSRILHYSCQTNTPTIARPTPTG